MERRTTIGVATGVTLTLAAVTVAIGLNVAIMSDRTPTTGPGTFEPAAEVAPLSAAGSTTIASTASAGAPTQPLGSSEPAGRDPDHDRGAGVHQDVHPDDHDRDHDDD